MGASFLKKGKAAHAMLDKSDADAEARKAAASGPRRFWIPDGKETQITFLDGDLDAQGMLEIGTFWEHQRKENGHHRNWYLCTQVDEDCPICAQGEHPYIAAVFTVIDHSEWKDNDGNVHKNQRRLFVAKKETLRRLQKIAAKRDGLTGVTFDVSRNGEKSASVGDTFDFVEKRSLAQIRKAYKLEEADAAPYDYDEVFVYRDAKTLKKMGFGAGGNGPVGSGETDDDEEVPAPKSKAGKAKAKPAQDEDYEEEV